MSLGLCVNGVVVIAPVPRLERWVWARQQRSVHTYCRGATETCASSTRSLLSLLDLFLGLFWILLGSLLGPFFIFFGSLLIFFVSLYSRAKQVSSEWFRSLWILCRGMRVSSSLLCAKSIFAVCNLNLHTPGFELIYTCLLINTSTHTYVYIHTCMYVYVCVCILVEDLN